MLALLFSGVGVYVFVICEQEYHVDGIKSSLRLGLKHLIPTEMLSEGKHLVQGR